MKSIYINRSDKSCIDGGGTGYNKHHPLFQVSKYFRDSFHKLPYTKYSCGFMNLSFRIPTHKNKICWKFRDMRIVGRVIGIGLDGNCWDNIAEWPNEWQNSRSAIKYVRMPWCMSGHIIPHVITIRSRIIANGLEL